MRTTGTPPPPHSAVLRLPLLRRWGLAALAVAGGAAAGAAQEGTAAEALARRDIEFARGLARDWQMIDLAEEVLAGIEARGVPKELAEEVALVECEIYAEGAKSESDPVLQDEHFTKAIDAYRAYIEKNPYSELLSQAERDYVDVANRYGNVLAARYAEAVGEEAQALRARIQEVLEDPIQLSSEIVSGLEATPDPSVKDLRELYRMMFVRGQLLHSVAKTSDEGVFFYAQAEKVLTDLAFKAGENTATGLFAYLEVARVKSSQGQFEESAVFSEYVVDQVMPSDPERRAEAWGELTPEEKRQRWQFVEWGTTPLVDALLAAGSTDEAIRHGLGFYNSWKREGLNLSRPDGYLALLSTARALLSGGGYVGGSLTGGDLAWFSTQDEMERAGFRSRRDQRSALDLALSIAQTVNQENRGNTLQIRAQKLISDVIERPGVEVSPAVLFEAAQGEYFNQNYATAIDAFKRVLGSIRTQDEATQKEFAPKVLYHLGESHRKLDRLLEAAMAYREGVTTWGGDPEYDERNARGYYGSLTQLRTSGLAGVQQIDTMWREAESLVAGVASDPGEIIFRQAMRLYDQEDFAGAREKFREVQPTADSYEKAQTYAALCLYKQKDLDGAERELTSYLTEFVSDTKNAVTKPQKVGARKEATAQASYYLGVIAYERANGNQAPFERVIERLADFDQRFPDQTDYATRALYMVMMSHLSLGEVDAAKGVLDHMVDVFPKERTTGTAALKIYKVLDAEREKARADGDEARAADLTRRMADAIHLSNSLNSDPGFSNLRVESRLWSELAEWAKAEEVLRDILKRYGASEENAKDVERYVKPDLAHALLEQREVQEAHDLLAPLVPKFDDAATDPRKPSRDVVRDYARSITGWIEWGDGAIVEVPGVGGAERLEEAVKYFGQLEQAVELDGEKWECPWYRARFDVAYAFAKWGEVNSEKRPDARATIATLRDDLSDDSLAPIATACGDDGLRKAFLWLWDRVQ